MAAWRVRMAPPADRATLDDPVVELLILAERDHLVGEAVEDHGEDVEADVQFERERHHPHRQIGDAQQRVELPQAVVEAHLADLAVQLPPGGCAMHLLHCRLQRAQVLKGEAQLQVVGRVALAVSPQPAHLQDFVQRGLAHQLFHRAQDDHPHAVGVEVLLLLSHDPPPWPC